MNKDAPPPPSPASSQHSQDSVGCRRNKAASVVPDSAAPKHASQVSVMEKSLVGIASV
jgi:hypothetical protein